MTRPVDWLYTASAIRISACRLGRIERASCRPDAVRRKCDSTVGSSEGRVLTVAISSWASSICRHVTISNTDGSTNVRVPILWLEICGAANQPQEAKGNSGQVGPASFVLLRLFRRSIVPSQS
jgi:hypothetical protein